MSVAARGWPGLDDIYKSTPMGYGSFMYYLGWTVTGQCSCIGGCLVGFVFHQLVPLTEACDAEPTLEDPHTGARIPRPGYEALAAKEKEPAAKVTSATSTASYEMVKPEPKSADPAANPGIISYSSC